MEHTFVPSSTPPCFRRRNPDQLHHIIVYPGKPVERCLVVPRGERIFFEVRATLPPTRPFRRLSHNLSDPESQRP